MMFTSKRRCAVMRTPRASSSFRRACLAMLDFLPERPSCDSVASKRVSSHTGPDLTAF